MFKQALQKQSDEAMKNFLLSGGLITIVKSRKTPKQVTAGAGSVKHCGRTNKFGQRI